MAESPNPYLTRRVQERKSELEQELEPGLANPSRPGPAGGLFIPTSAMAGNFFLHARLLTHALSSRMTILTQLVRFWEKISRCAGNLFIVILSTQRIPGGDLVENHCFIEVKLANVCRFSDFARGTMREKMAIFKERNSVRRGPKFSMGAMLMKIVILLREN